MLFFREIRLAVRRLGREAGFASVIILILTLAVGANSAIFGVVYAVLLHPAGVDAPERIAMLRTHYGKMGIDFPIVSVPDFADAASQKSQVEAAALDNPVGYNLDLNGTVQYLGGAQVSWQWFQVFGARPILGRTFNSTDDQPGANYSAVLSYATWEDTFGGDKNILGKTIFLNQKSYQIIGVMRSDFSWPRGVKVWTPLGLPSSAYSPKARFDESYHAAIRLRPKVDFNQFLAALKVKSYEEYAREGQNGFAVRADWEMAAVPLTQSAAGKLRNPLYVLFAVVLLVLLIASANVAGLFLARASSRTREFAIRTALGASAKHLITQLMAETALLAGAATLLGVIVGPVFGRLLLWMIPRSLAQGYSISTSFSVLLFTAAVGLSTSSIAGVGPAIKMVSARRRLELHEGGRSATASHDKQRLRSIFVISEIALAFVLLVGAGMFLTTLKQLQHVDPGFNASGVLAGTLNFAGGSYQDDQLRQEAFVKAIMANLKGRPGVSYAAATSSLPFSDQDASGSFHIQDQSAGPNDPGPHSSMATVTAAYLKVMQIPLLAGRWITDSDHANTQPVVVIDQRLAHRYWPNQNPLGQQLRLSNSDPWSVVVGVVGNVHAGSLESDNSEGMRYYPYSEYPNPEADIVIRTSGQPQQLVRTLKSAVAEADSNQTMFDIGPLEARVSNSLGSRRLLVWLLSSFAFLALILSMAGIYGLISYVTSQRQNEFGIRMALGAKRTDVLGLVMKQASVWIGLGLCAGVVLSAMTTVLIRHLFEGFGVGAVSTALEAIAITFAVGLVAGLLPAQRAAAIDPAIILRSE